MSEVRKHASRLWRLGCLGLAALLPALVLDFFFDTYELLIFFNTTALITSLLFVARYSFVTWEKTQTGIVTMGISFCVLLICSGGLARNLTTQSTDNAYDIILALAYYGVTVVMPWRLMLVNKAQSENRELLLIETDEDDDAG